jgi:hypothetical protein
MAPTPVQPRQHATSNHPHEPGRSQLTDIRIYAANQMHPADIHAGQHVRFLYLPNGKYTTPEQGKPVEWGTVQNDTGRTIDVTWTQPGAIFRNRLRTIRTTLLRRMHSPSPTPVYRVADCIGELEFLD